MHEADVEVKILKTKSEIGHVQFLIEEGNEIAQVQMENSLMDVLPEGKINSYS